MREQYQYRHLPHPMNKKRPARLRLQPGGSEKSSSNKLKALTEDKQEPSATSILSKLHGQGKLDYSGLSGEELGVLFIISELEDDGKSKSMITNELLDSI